MRIVHVNDMAFVASRLAKAQRDLGHDAIVVHLPGGPASFNLSLLREARRHRRIDVLHVHGGIRRSQLSVPYLRKFQANVLVVHYHGSDVRSGTCLHYQSYADAQICATPDLLSLLNRSPTSSRWHREGVLRPVWIPNPIEPMPWAPDPPARDRVLFGHFPSKPEMKGTDKILTAFRRAFPHDEAELMVITGRPHDVALDRMRECDAIIDQLTAFGMYGVVSTEAMAMGRPVLSSYDPTWFSPLGKCPVVELDEFNAVQMLRLVAQDRRLRVRLGEEGRAWVAKVHDASRIAERTLALYESARLWTEIT